MPYCKVREDTGCLAQVGCWTFLLALPLVILGMFLLVRPYLDRWLERMGDESRARLMTESLNAAHDRQDDLLQKSRILNQEFLRSAPAKAQILSRFRQSIARLDQLAATREPSLANADVKAEDCFIWTQSAPIEFQSASGTSGHGLPSPELTTTAESADAAIEESIEGLGLGIFRQSQRPNSSRSLEARNVFGTEWSEVTLSLCDESEIDHLVRRTNDLFLHLSQATTRLDQSRCALIISNIECSAPTTTISGSGRQGWTGGVASASVRLVRMNDRAVLRAFACKMLLGDHTDTIEWHEPESLVPLPPTGFESAARNTIVKFGKRILLSQIVNQLDWEIPVDKLRDGMTNQPLEQALQKALFSSMDPTREHLRAD